MAQYKFNEERFMMGFGQDPFRTFTDTGDLDSWNIDAIIDDPTSTKEEYNPTLMDEVREWMQYESYQNRNIVDVLKKVPLEQMLRHFRIQAEIVAQARKDLEDRIKEEGMVSKQMYMAEEMTDAEREASNARYEANKADEQAKADVNKQKKKANKTASPFSGVTQTPGLFSSLDFKKLWAAIKKATKASKSFGWTSTWYGPIPYEYSGIYHPAQEMSPGFAQIARQLEIKLGKPNGYFNSALMNLFKNGKGIGPHADNEQIYWKQDDINEIGAVATISLGAAADITLSRNDGTKEPYTFTTSNGDLYVMPDGS